MLCRPPFLFLLLAGSSLLLGLPSVIRAQALEELREDVRTNSPSQPDDDPPRASRNDSDGYGYDDSDNWGELLAFAIVAPFWGPPVWIGDTYTETGYFSHFPHQYDRGYMLIGAADIGELPDGGQPYVWAARARAEYGTDFSHVDWIGGHLLFDTSSRIGLECDVRYVSEERQFTGPITVARVIGGGDSNLMELHYSSMVQAARFTRRDSLWFGDGNLLFRFAQSEYLVMRTGLGINFLSDRDRTDFGFNFTYGGDFFPIRPLVVSGELDLGTLGHTSVYHFRGTLGANWRTTEAYIGYDYYDIGRTQIAGLVAGVRLWY